MRIKNSIRNTFVSISGQMIGIVLNFVSRTFFIYVLGTEYLGINGLFTNILSVLSLAELGVGSAITYNLYRPLAENDKYKISALMNLYAKAYKIIGCIVAGLGICIIPFLSNITNSDISSEYLTLIYILFLSNSVSTYFFAYKRALIIADQKGYKDTINRYIFNFLQCILQILILICTKNYILYLCTQILFSVLANIVMSRKVDLEYSYLKDNKGIKLTEEESKVIFKHVYAMMSHKLGGVVVGGTDNLLISSMIGVHWVGLYSNYTMITGIINSLVGQIFNAITASIGNLNVTESADKKKEIFNIVFFVNAWIYGFCSITLMNLLNPFIVLWIGEEYLLDNSIVMIIILNFFLMGMRHSTISYNTTLGLFWNDRYKPWVEAIINLVASIYLLKTVGLIGVFLGTLISTVLTSFWVDPYILYRYGFKEKVSDYFKRYLVYVMAIGVAAIVTTSICKNLVEVSIITIGLKLLICIVVINLTLLVCFYNTKEFKYIYVTGTKILRINKNNN